MNRKLVLLGTLVLLVLAAVATAIAADEENWLFLPAVSGGVTNAVTWTPTSTSTSTATPAPTDVSLPPDDLIDCSNPDYASLPVCQGGATPKPTPGGTIP